MAVLYISEYQDVSKSPSNTLQAPIVPAIATQTVAISGSSAQSSAFNAATRLVRVHADVVCSLLFGTNPTATTSSPRLAAGQTEYFAVEPGSGLKAAVISNT